MSLNILNNIGPAFAPEAKVVLDAVGKVDYVIPKQTDIASVIGKYDVIVCGLANNFNAEVLSAGKKLKAIATATTGLDHIDMKTAEKMGIKILSLRGEDKLLDTISGTAELALCLMLALARNVPPAISSVMRGEWKREEYCGHSVRGATLGIVGLGRLGRMMEAYGEALGMKVIFTDPNVKGGVPFEKLLSESDYISINVHLTPETEHMFDSRAFGLMKKGAFLVNTSRGKIVDESALIDALEKGALAGYATDVLDGETDFGGAGKDGGCSYHPLVKYAKTHPNAIITPHIGGMTFESRRDTDVFIAKKLADFLKLS